MGHKGVYQVAEQQGTHVPGHGIKAIMHIVDGRPGMQQQGAQRCSTPINYSRVKNQGKDYQQCQSQPMQGIEPQCMANGESPVLLCIKVLERMMHGQ